MSVEAVVARVFNLDPALVTDESSRDTIEEWDSMGNMSLVLGLEEEFKVSLSIADAMDMTSVQQIKKVLREYGVSL
jgi:acyl carrier protein